MKYRSLVLYILLILLVVPFNKGLAQVVESAQKITLPVPPSTNLQITNGQVVRYKSSVEIEILPETDIQEGADVIFEIGPVLSPATMKMNWITARVFDPSGVLLGESKKFYDFKGSITQSLVANLTAQKVLVNQVVNDIYGRPVLTSLAAPKAVYDFNYADDFLTYNYSNFDRPSNRNNPQPVSNTEPGSLGWYYSNNNTWESRVPATGFPYSRVEYYNDGSRAQKSIAGIGEAFRLGQGHESRTFTAPVYDELSFYAYIRNRFFTATEMGQMPEQLYSGATQTVQVDASGQYTIVIQDRDGRLLMTARPGTALTGSNSILISKDKAYYFVLSTPSAINIGSNATLINMTTGLQVSTSGTLPVGYYKLLPNDVLMQLGYSFGFSEISFYYYNQLGQLKAVIPPRGVAKLLTSEIDSYASKENIPFITLNEFDTKGRVKSSFNPEQGKSEFVYRTDGKPRFSQDARQRATAGNPYSYINYDYYDRVVESGEFFPGSGGIVFNPAGMANADINAPGGGLGTGTKAGWLKTTYDNPLSTGITGYDQNPYYLGGVVSYTENIGGAKTWFNYDEHGQVLWTVMDLPGIGKKTIDYTYNGAEDVIKTVYQKNTAAETFVHYYEYDLDQRLSAVYTNTTDDPGTKIVQAKYYHYLHGPLKRKELGGNVQGIDYTYTAQGWLKAMNHASRDLDPSQDGISGVNAGFARDAIGLNLEYYSGDYTRSGANIGSVSPSSVIAPDQYSGNIKAMGWHSRKPSSVISLEGAGIENTTMYAFSYDNKYQLNAATWGTPDYNTQGFAASSAFGENNMSYDIHGNLQALNRTNAAGTLTDNFTYNYFTNSDKLQSISNGGAAFKSFSYDQTGKLNNETNASGPARYMKYNENDQMEGVYADAGFTQPVITYQYNERGIRTVKKDWINNLTTYYISDLNGNDIAIYEQVGAGAAVLTEQPLYAVNRIGVFMKQAAGYDYELTDHLGSIRAIIDRTKQIKWYSDYYPYGYRLREGGTRYRTGFQGKYSEFDNETGWNSFDMRMYDSRMARWLSPDPKEQYYSSYVGMGNNPVNGVDKDGAEWEKLKADWYRLWHGGEVVRLSNGYAVIKGPNAMVWRFKNLIPGTITFRTKATLTAGLQAGVSLNSRDKDDPNSVKDDPKDKLEYEFKINFGSVRVLEVEQDLANSREEKKLTYMGDGSNLKWKHGISVTGKLGKLEAGGSRSIEYETYSGYNGPRYVEGTANEKGKITVIKKIWGIDPLVKPTVKAESNPQPSPGPKKEFYGIDFSTSAMLLLGVDLDVRIGVEY